MRTGQLPALSPCEAKVAIGVMWGLSNLEIAQVLHREPKTIKNQMDIIRRKWGPLSRAEIAVLLYRMSQQAAQRL